MYLRRIRYPDCTHYVIRQSVVVEARWLHRDIVDLGCDPARYIIYPGNQGFYFDPELEEELQAKGVEYSDSDLERMFIPFMEPHIRTLIERYYSGSRSNTRTRTKPSKSEMLEQQSILHSFDKRRMHFLRFGRLDIGELEGRPWPFLKILAGKSRDEIEHTLEGMEQVLRPHEIRSYIYTGLNLQSCFPHHLLRNHPGSLDPEEVDEAFVKEICRLDGDEKFFMGNREDTGGKLHPYLVKYVILYFDSAFPGVSSDEYIREFIRRHKVYRQPPSKASMAVSEACGIVGITVEEYRSMKRGQLIRIYRKQVQKVHPDKGGDHESFVRLTEAYEILLAQK